MAQAGVSARSRRERYAEVWLDASEQDMWASTGPRSRPEATSGRPAGPGAAPAPVRAASPDSGRPVATAGAGRGPVLASSPGERPSAGVPGRRTVTITGRGVERHDPRMHATARNRPQRRAHEREGFRPDRAGLWAVLLGIVVLLVAATSSHGAIRQHASTSVPARAPALHAAPHTPAGALQR